jgi:predicted  nucleic acid-binding Zn-ribbon protein
VTTCDDTDAGTNVVTEPGVDANIEAAGADASTGVDPGADAGADNGTDSGADADHEAGADADADADSSADTGSDASADTGSDAGADASADADNDHVSLKLFSKRFFDLNVDSVGRVFELTHTLKVVMSDILVSRL